MGKFLPLESYNDEGLKKHFCKHSVALVGHQYEYKKIDDRYIDTHRVDDPSYGCELEISSEPYDYTARELFGNKFKFPKFTINAPWDRKERYYVEYHPKRWDVPFHEFFNPMVRNPNFDKNTFGRFTYFYHQFIYLDNETIRNRRKRIIKETDKAQNSGNQIELFASWYLEHATIKNWIDNEWVVQTDDPRTHLPPISEDEWEKMLYEVKVIKLKIKNEEARKKEEQEKIDKEERERLGRQLNPVERRELAVVAYKEYKPIGLPKKSDLDKLGVPQYETQIEPFIRKHNLKV